MSYTTENMRIAQAYGSICEARESIRDKTLREWQAFLGDRMAVVETQEGEIYYDYDPKTDSFVYGGASNAGILPEGRVKYDHYVSMRENLENVVEEIEAKYGIMDDNEE